MVRRLVGFYEYGNALDDLDQLVSIATEDDRKVINEIVSDRPEFDIYLTLPESFSIGDGSESTVVTPVVRGESSGVEYRRSGLGWVTALARVEFGAMIAGFTDHPSPYENVTPQSHDYLNAMQLLLEGISGHHAALAENPLFAGRGRVKRKDATIFHSLTLSRRARITRAMLEPLLAPGESEYDPRQAYELGEYKKELDKGQKLVNGQVKMFLATRQSSSTSSSESEFVRACRAQLRAEQRELAAGTATVTNFRN